MAAVIERGSVVPLAVSVLKGRAGEIRQEIAVLHERERAVAGRLGAAVVAGESGANLRAELSEIRSDLEGNYFALSHLETLMQDGRDAWRARS